MHFNPKDESLIMNECHVHNCAHESTNVNKQTHPHVHKHADKHPHKHISMKRNTHTHLNKHPGRSWPKHAHRPFTALFLSLEPLHLSDEDYLNALKNLLDSQPLHNVG